MLDANDPHHRGCRELLESHRGPVFVPMLVITEVAQLALSRLGTAAEAAFLTELSRGDLSVMAVEPSEWPRIAELVWRYRDLPLGAVDASVVALADRLKIKQIATLDRRHFSVVRPAHVEAFELLP
jgi:predicted nucleic acid-binding protein